MSSSASVPKDLPHGIEGLEAYPFEWGPWLLFLLVAVILALAFFAYRYWQQKKISQVHTRDFAKEIYQEIRDLQVPELFEKKQQEQFFYDLSFRLRQYLEFKLGLTITDMTFKELQEPLLKQEKLSEDLKDNIIAFLKKAEFIKFAHKLATRSEAADSKEIVLDWCRAVEKSLRDEEEGKHDKS